MTLAVQASGAAREAVEREVPTLDASEVAQRLAAQDHTLWGEAAESEASIRLGWLDAPTASRPLVAEIEALRDELRAEGVDRVVLCGMGGSSLAPEVICATAGVPLVVLDGTDPGQVGRAVSTDLDRTVVVVSSKSGSTVETDSQRRAFVAAFEAAGIDPTRRVVVVTDPGSPLEQASTEAGYRRVFTADPHVGGRYSALTAFGLVPSGLAGADVGALLDSAAAALPRLSGPGADNPALVLGAVLGATQNAAGTRRDKVAIVDDGSGLVGFGDWAEQLIAESTGKDATGTLPVVVDADAPEARTPASDVVVAHLGDDGATLPDDGAARVLVTGDLGEQLLLWETATAVAGRLLGIDPFDQPDVESAKKAARGLLDARPEPSDPDLVDQGVEVRGTPGLLDGVTDLAGAVDALLAQLAGDGYVAVMAYLDREADAALAQVRTPLALRTGRPVTFGWGPRFLHSTGQYHKGGPLQGVFLQVTSAPAGDDVEIPDQPFTFGTLIAAQAAGDAQVLADHGRPVLRLHLTDRAAQLPVVTALLGGSGS
ncbi:glucose-6-phosphate isomerase [Angustibacter speluncae]